MRCSAASNPIPPSSCSSPLTAGKPSWLPGRISRALHPAVPAGNGLPGHRQVFPPSPGRHRSRLDLCLSPRLPVYPRQTPPHHPVLPRRLRRHPQALQSLGLLVGIHIPAALAAILSRCPQNNPLKIQTGLLHCFVSGEGLFFIHQPPIPAGVPHHTLSAPGCPG